MVHNMISSAPGFFNILVKASVFYPALLPSQIFCDSGLKLSHWQFVKKTIEKILTCFLLVRCYSKPQYAVHEHSLIQLCKHLPIICFVNFAVMGNMFTM